MKRYAPLVMLLALGAVLVVPLMAQTKAALAPAPVSDRSPAAPIAGAIATVTGIAISPLLGTGAYGAYHYWRTPAEQRGQLPWYAQVSFWLPALAIVGACAAKDALGATLPPGWKKPLDVLETVENKATGLVAAGAVVPFTMAAMSKMIVGSDPVSSAADPLLLSSGLATIQLGAIDGSWLLSVLTVPFGVAVFALVWMASHAINALILLSPWGAIDATLKAARTGLLGLVTATSMLNPWVGAALSLVVIVVAYFVAGWAFRLTVFGSVFCWDFFTLRRLRFQPSVDRANWAFSAGAMAAVPTRTYGRLIKAQTGALEFRFRPWLVLPEQSVSLPAADQLAVGRGLFFSLIEGEQAGYCFLPPRYRGHEEALATLYGFKTVREAGLRKAWGWIRETMGYGRAASAVSAATVT